jgi:hypothetical protein
MTSRAVLILAGEPQRTRAVSWVHKAPAGTRVEFRAPKRTTDQNAKLWAMLTDIAQQKEHCGRKYTTDQWKCLFLHALGKEMQFIPSLDGSTFLPYGNSSSALSKSEMAELIEFITAWGAQNGVVFGDD